MIRNRRMDAAELDTILGWAADEGWNPGLDDASAFFSADPDGFFVAIDDDGPVAAISVVNHSDVFAFLGLYLCKPSHRGRGIGYRLWQYALNHAQNRTVGLDGVPEQQQNYHVSGFERSGGTVRYTGTLSGARSDELRDARDADIPALIALEGQASRWHKPRYLSGWLKPTATRRTIVLEADSTPLGFATVRACRKGAKIGPLIASDDATASALIRHCAATMGPDLCIDVPSSSTGLDALCRKFGFAPGFETARMYRGPAEPTRDLFYAVGSLELG